MDSRTVAWRAMVSKTRTSTPPPHRFVPLGTGGVVTGGQPRIVATQNVCGEPVVNDQHRLGSTDGQVWVVCGRVVERGLECTRAVPVVERANGRVAERFPAPGHTGRVASYHGKKLSAGFGFDVNAHNQHCAPVARRSRPAPAESNSREPHCNRKTRVNPRRAADPSGPTSRRPKDGRLFRPSRDGTAAR